MTKISPLPRRVREVGPLLSMKDSELPHCLTEVCCTYPYSKFRPSSRAAAHEFQQQNMVFITDQFTLPLVVGLPIETEHQTEQLKAGQRFLTAEIIRSLEAIKTGNQKLKLKFAVEGLSTDDEGVATITLLLPFSKKSFQDQDSQGIFDDDDVERNFEMADLMALSSISQECCMRCGKSEGENAAEILICDGCDGEAHLPCVDLETCPVGEWFCPLCRVIAPLITETESENKETSMDFAASSSPASGASQVSPAKRVRFSSEEEEAYETEDDDDEEKQSIVCLPSEQLSATSAPDDTCLDLPSTDDNDVEAPQDSISEASVPADEEKAQVEESAEDHEAESSSNDLIVKSSGSSDSSVVTESHPSFAVVQEPSEIQPEDSLRVQDLSPLDQQAIHKGRLRLAQTIHQVFSHQIGSSRPQLQLKLILRIREFVRNDIEMLRTKMICSSVILAENLSDFSLQELADRQFEVFCTRLERAVEEVFQGLYWTVGEMKAQIVDVLDVQYKWFMLELGALLQHIVSTSATDNTSV